MFSVEDSASLQLFYKTVLIVNGFDLVGIADNGEEAVSMFKSFNIKPKVILMDYRIPIKDGIAAAREILQIDRNSKIIFTTADESIKEEALSLGIFSFMEKPFTINALIDEIKKACQA